jgi:PIN domain nuclease of toxin-antitoxin system
MERVVADTHAVVWYLTEPRKLGAAARRAFAAADDGRWLCCVPAIALVEISLLNERGRTEVSPGDVLKALAGRSGYAVLGLDAEQAQEFAVLRGLKDPMDRLVVAAARATRSRLLSIDDTMDGYGVERLWD